MAQYHVNEKTGRPNKCTATVRACPVGGEHYASKEDAIEGIQNAAATENSTFTKLKKASTRNDADTPKTAATNEELFSKLMKIDPDKITAKQIEADFISELDFYADFENPGCGGCDGSDSDYCRCKTYTGQVSFTPQEMAYSFYSQYAKNRDHAWSYSRLDDDSRKVVDELSFMMTEHELSDTQNYEVESSMDYYGEALERIIVRDSSRFETFHERLVEMLNDDKEN